MNYLEQLIADYCFKYSNNEVTENEVIEFCKETGIDIDEIIVCA